MKRLVHFASWIVETIWYMPAKDFLTVLAVWLILIWVINLVYYGAR